ncbi:UDP-glucose 6-dehydrogenase [Cryptosporidium ryanae]|uniref:UDP-glucose 6-dehydrogenase n=1 Tax=Cryptosporidium ryanae TaxID=515981 RepID=UPI00351A2A10|nr:UDP-glucose 6-dehydrogenase [Cryptosporidium ryanae]
MNDNYNLDTTKIGCIGAGYVGGPTMAVMAYKCPHLKIYVADVNETRINQWNSSVPPIYEPGLNNILDKTKNINLFFTTNIEMVIKECDILFIAVNTPTKSYGVGKGSIPDLSMWEECARSIAKYSNKNKIIIEKSTVPVKTCDLLLETLNSCKINKNIQFSIISNPEFLSEGTSIYDLEYPDRLLIGGKMDCKYTLYSMDILKNIYLNWIPESKILMISVWSSELTKLASNAFLAQRISSINSISRLCELTGANINQVSNAVGCDNRIGSKFLGASLGFGGSCFKKDILCLSYLFEHYNLKEDALYWKSISELNDYQTNCFSERIIKYMFNNIKNKKISILGFSFKKDTSDVRETPAAIVCQKLIGEGAKLFIHDPRVDSKNIIFELEKKNHLCSKETCCNSNKVQNVTVAKNIQDCFNDSHALVFCTDWDAFTNIDFQSVFNLMEKPAYIFDGRNFLDHQKLFKIGFNVISIGISPMVHSSNSHIMGNELPDVGKNMHMQNMHNSFGATENTVSN